MSKLKPDVNIIRSGIFTQWDEDSDDLPTLTKATVHVPAEIDIEFGFVAQIKKAKNQVLRYCIYHPNIGDTIWAPEHNKVGKWRMTLELKGKIIAEKTSKVHMNEDDDKIGAFWKRRGF